MSKTIVFFGSGPVAAASLRLLAQDFDIEAVITKPRPPHHRGSVPVLELAQELSLPVHLANDAHELEKLFAAKPVKSELAVLIDFGIIVSPPVIDYFSAGIINSHFSILPEWRGADPITFSILSGQKQTGVSLMLVNEGLDEGNILSFAEYNLPEDINTPLLTKNLIDLSHALLKEAVPKQLQNPEPGMPQSVTGREVSYSNKLSKQDGIIDWTKPAVQLEREVRAYLDWPRSRTKLGNIDVVITKSHVMEGSGEPGKLEIQNKQLGVYCGQDMLLIDSLIPAGKKEMSAQAFLNGYQLS